MSVHLQEKLFDLQSITQTLKKLHNSGASVTFEGYVRDFDLENENLDTLELEHYPGMTEKALLEIENLAIKRWHLDDVYIVHRYGKLNVGEPMRFLPAVHPPESCKDHRLASLRREAWFHTSHASAIVSLRLQRGSQRHGPEALW